MPLDAVAPTYAEVTAALEHADWLVRRAAVSRVAGLLRGTPPSVVTDFLAKALERAAEDPKHEVRGEVARALLGLHHPSFMSTVSRLCGDAHSAVAAQAEATLKRRTQSEASEGRRRAEATQLAAEIQELSSLYGPDEVARFAEAFEDRREQEAAAVVHDVGHLLGAVRTIVEELCDLAREHKLPDSRWATQQEEAERRLRRIHEIVTAQAELAEATPTELQRVVLREAVDEAVSTACRHLRRPAVAVAVDVGKHLELRAPRTSLVRALTNVLTNALKATKGTVSVRADQPRQGEVRVSVTDDGPGLPAAARDALLTGVTQVLARRAEHGWGLVITHRLVTVHCRGRTDVAESPGGGTTISFHLPLRSEGEAP